MVYPVDREIFFQYLEQMREQPIDRLSLLNQIKGVFVAPCTPVVAPFPVFLSKLSSH